MVTYSRCRLSPHDRGYTAQSHQTETHSNQTSHKHQRHADGVWRGSRASLSDLQIRNNKLLAHTDTKKNTPQNLSAYESLYRINKVRVELTMATLLVCSRVRIRSLLTVVSAMSTLSSASSSSCWTFLKRTVLQLTCSSWWKHRGTTAAS